MVYVDIPFPERIAFQARSEPMWNTTLTAVISGYEATNQNWSDARHSYDAGLAIRTASDFLLVKAHFHQMRGRAKSFPFFDPIDHTVAATAGVVLDTETGWQLHYRYGSGGDAYDRKISRPKFGTVTIYRTRGVTTIDATAFCTLDYETGAISAITGFESDDIYTWQGDFYVPCRYDVDRLPAVIANKQPGPAGELFVDCDSLPIVEVRE